MWIVLRKTIINNCNNLIIIEYISFSVQHHVAKVSNSGMLGVWIQMETFMILPSVTRVQNLQTLNHVYRELVVTGGQEILERYTTFLLTEI